MRTTTASTSTSAETPDQLATDDSKCAAGTEPCPCAKAALERAAELEADLTAIRKILTPRGPTPNHTPIATAVAARIQRDENDAHWLNDIADKRLQAALIRNQIVNNPVHADAILMAHLSWSNLVCAHAAGHAQITEVKK